ncbi:protein-tyrosine phosphatase-like protein [Trichoderma evansii]
MTHIKDKCQKLGQAHRARTAQGNLGDARWTLYKQPDDHTNMDRYENIRPFVHNRVKLQVPENTSEYLNASPINLPSPSDPSQPPLRYIAMQGPIEESIDHVWRMIAEQTSSPAVIVQITNMVEFTEDMGTHYFPYTKEPWNINESNRWDDGWRAKLSDVSSEINSGEKTNFKGFEVCKLLLHVHREKEPRVVWHFLYMNYYDYGDPSLDDLPGFVDIIKVSSKYSAPSSKRIIHCNSGVGQTGVFIALDHLIRELDLGALANHDLPHEGPDLIYNAVESLSQQRHGMVQRQSHYLLLYQAMKQLWHKKYDVVDEEA